MQALESIIRGQKRIFVNSNIGMNITEISSFLPCWPSNEAGRKLTLEEIPRESYYKLGDIYGCEIFVLLDVKLSDMRIALDAKMSDILIELKEDEWSS